MRNSGSGDGARGEDRSSRPELEWCPDGGPSLPAIRGGLGTGSPSSRSCPSFSPTRQNEGKYNVGGGMDSPSSLASLRKSARSRAGSGQSEQSVGSGKRKRTPAQQQHLLNMKNHDRHSSSLSPSKARPRAKAKTNNASSTMRFTNGGNPWTSMPLEKLVQHQNRQGGAEARARLVSKKDPLARMMQYGAQKQHQKQQQEQDARQKAKGSFDLGSDSGEQEYDAYRSQSAPSSVAKGGEGGGGFGGSQKSSRISYSVTVRASHLKRWRKMLLSKSKAVRQEGVIAMKRGWCVAQW